MYTYYRCHIPTQRIDVCHIKDKDELEMLLSLHRDMGQMNNIMDLVNAWNKMEPQYEWKYWV